ncbi:MAG: type II secretion system F family protein [Phycisphaerales bacterium]|nr:MAG: type II secretion system F family protein [Phycisphaerales bacterium]
MNLPQLAQYSEGLGKMLGNGIELKRALYVAGECMVAGENRRFADQVSQALLTGEDLPTQAFSGVLPPFYLTVLECGLLTGRVPQALTAAAHYIRQVLPVRHTWRRCWRYALVAYLVCITITLAFGGRPSFVALSLLAGLFVLPRWIGTLAYGRDALLAKMPFVGTWIRQVALLEFFSCLEVCYDSTLPVPQMFRASINAVGNRFLRRDLLEAQAAVERGDSFADALAAVSFIPEGMIADVNANEICGKLELSFAGFARELRKLIEAKIEALKLLAAAFVISYGILVPLMIVLPVFLDFDKDLLLLYLAVVMGDLWVISTFNAAGGYMRKATAVNCWWEGLHTETKR